MNDPFSPPPRVLRLDSAPPPASPFGLRFDYEANAQGRAGGLPLQSTEWQAIAAPTWAQAKAAARAIVNAIPACRWTGAHYLQGACLVELTEAAPFRTLAFRRA